MRLFCLLCMVTLLQCSLFVKETRRAVLTSQEKELAGQLMLNPDYLAELQANPCIAFLPMTWMLISASSISISRICVTGSSIWPARI